MKLNMQFFAEGAAAGAPAASAATVGGAPAQESTQNVVYGKDETQGAQHQQSESPKAKTGQAPKPAAGAQDGAQEKSTEPTFDELIHGKYKDEYGKSVQKIINSRFKDQKGMQEKLDSMSPILDSLRGRYGLTADADAQAIQAAIEADESYYEQEADRRGVSVEQYKAYRQIMNENAMLRQQQQQLEQAQQVQQITDKWTEEAERLAEKYPGFDLQTEMQNERFYDLLCKDIGVQNAYELIHRDEIYEGLRQSGSQSTVDTIKSRGMRPPENGSGGSVGIQIRKSDPSKLTDHDRAEIRKKVARGERIVF